MISSHPSPASADAAARPSPGGVAQAADETDAERMARQLSMLRRLDEICMDMAEAVRRQVMEPAPAAEEAPDLLGGHDVSLVLNRIGRTLRLNMALENKIVEDHRTRDERIAQRLAETAGQVAAERRGRMTRTKTRVRHEVERAIREEADPSEAETLLRQLEFRLEDETFDEEFADGPAGEYLDHICDLLRIPFNWTRWANVGCEVEDLDEDEEDWDEAAADPVPDEVIEPDQPSDRAEPIQAEPAPAGTGSDPPAPGGS